MKFSIITPCRNASRYIAETVRSVVSQQGDFSIEYLIMDGASTDDTLDIVNGLAEPSADRTIKIYSEPDTGMYEAVAKGLRLATGDWIGYLNASDFYHPGALQTLATCLERFPALRWVSGRRSWCDEAGNIAPTSLPFGYRRDMIRSFVYGTALPHIPQESTLWHRELVPSLDLERLASYHYAGDFYLWHTFAGTCELQVIDANIGCFRVHTDQLSQSTQYDEEARYIANGAIKPGLLALLAHRAAWHTPERWRRQLSAPISPG